MGRLRARASKMRRLRVGAAKMGRLRAGAAEREGSAKMADYFLLDPHL